LYYAVLPDWNPLYGDGRYDGARSGGLEMGGAAIFRINYVSLYADTDRISSRKFSHKPYLTVFKKRKGQMNKRVFIAGVLLLTDFCFCSGGSFGGTGTEETKSLLSDSGPFHLFGLTNIYQQNLRGAM
jgi:hypothetical protein